MSKLTETLRRWENIARSNPQGCVSVIVCDVEMLRQQVESIESENSKLRSILNKLDPQTY